MTSINLNNIGLILGALASIGGLVVVIAYSYGQFKKGSNESKFDTINLFKEQVDALEQKVGNQEEEIKKLRVEIHDLHVAIDEKEKKLGEVLTILQGRDPQTQETIKMMSEYIALNKPIMEKVAVNVLPVVAKLDKFLDKQTF